MQKRISVVIPAYNAENSLQKCLDSVFSSSYNNFEVIIVNDCSSDNSVEVAKKYPSRIINLSEQRGPAFARDKGIALAKGEIVAFLDSDCIVPKDWLGKINTKLTYDIVGIGGKYNLPNDTNTISHLFMTYWDPKNIFYKKARDIISFSGGNCAFWKSYLIQKRKKRELAYFNRSVGGDDTIMCYEIRKYGKLIYSPDLTVLHNKECSLLNVLKETIALGYAGAAVTRLCGGLLIKEPHRLYKFILYLLSVSLIFLSFLLSFAYIRQIYIWLLVFYVVLTLPFMLFIQRAHLSEPIYLLFFPVIVFLSDILNFIGHIKKAQSIIWKKVKSVIWYAKFIINAIYPSGLSRVFFFVIKQCNARCYFCFNKKDGQIRQENNDLSLEEIKNMTTKIGFLPWLTITGGEPFLRKDIHEICRLFYNNCDTRIISIATNGLLSLYTEETVEKILIDCERLDLRIIVALDDIRDGHDRIKGVKNAYTRALTTLKKLKDLQSRFPGLTLEINTILIKENAGHIGEILDHFRNNLKPDRQCLNLLRQPPCTSVKSELISAPKYFDLVATKTFNGNITHFPYSIKQRFHQAVLEYNCRRASEEFNLKKSLATCLAAQKFLVINNNGAIFPCELLTDELGNLKDEEYDLQKLIKSSRAKNIRLKIRDTSCYCQWPCAVGFNGYYKISFYPEIFKDIICGKQKGNIQI